jgi:peptidoglycan/LPS O-acetylase OafA/YrhL
MKVNFPYYNLLDGLRGLAIVAVIYAHSSLASSVYHKLQLSNGGYIGVDIFFVLSSFLITSLLIKEYLNNDRIDIKKFFWRRFIRLSPPLAIAIAIFIPIIATIDWLSALKELFYALTYSANIVRSLRNFLPSSWQPTYFSHTWSLATEEQFYLFFPFFFAWAIGFRKELFKNTSRILAVIFILFATAPLFKPILGDGIYDFPLWRAGEFAIGSIVAVIYANIQWPLELQAKTPFLLLPPRSIDLTILSIRSSVLSAISFWIFLAFIFCVDANSWFALSCGHFLVSVITGFLLLQITIRPNRTIERVLGSPLMMKIGALSYGLYLYHHPIATLETWYFDRVKLNDLLSLLLPAPIDKIAYVVIYDLTMISATAVIAYISYRAIELPLMKYKQRHASPTK